MTRKETRRLKSLELNQIVSKKDLLKRFRKHKGIKKWNKETKAWKVHSITSLLIDYKYTIIIKREAQCSMVYNAESKRQLLKWIEIEGSKKKKDYIKEQFISLPMIINKDEFYY